MICSAAHKRVVGGPGRAALAMHVEHEAADRHRRIAAIVDQVVPIAVAELGDVEPERGEQILGVARRQLALVELRPQRDADRIVVAAAEQGRLQPVEQRELLRRRQRGMVGDVVGGAHEIVEREDRRAVARMDEPRGHRKILVPMALARSRFGGVIIASPIRWPARAPSSCRPVLAHIGRRNRG